jgi:hypothetical protein
MHRHQAALMYTDFATITITDARGRTLFQVVKEKPDSGWVICDFKTSPKHQARYTEAANEALATGAEPNSIDWPTVGKGHHPPDRFKRLPDGRRRLDVPGPPLPWDPLPPILDRLIAEFGTVLRLTVDELRACIADS